MQSVPGTLCILLLDADHAAGKEWYVFNFRRSPNTHALIQLYVVATCIRCCYWQSTVHALCSTHPVYPSRQLLRALTMEHHLHTCAVVTFYHHLCMNLHQLPKENATSAQVATSDTTTSACVFLHTYVYIYNYENMYCIIILHILYYYIHNYSVHTYNIPII